jgi:YD repeat-containing protein
MVMGRFAAGMARGLLAAALLFPPGVSSAAQSTQYTYDALGRVLSAIDGSGRKVVYSYDSAGNRTRVSNGAEFQEIVPTAWSASSNAGTTGLVTANAMKDGDFSALASIHATNTEANAWIAADLGSAKTVNHIDVAPAIATTVAAAPEDLNGTVVEYSLDGAKWSAAATINGVSPGATRTVALGGISARYVRIRRSISGQVALGDLRLFSAAVANSPLIAQPDSITSTGLAVTFDPRINDQDLDGYAFTVSSVEDPPHGAAVVNAGVSITYTPDPGYFGADSFLYSVADGHNGTASARVTVLVRPSTNHAPVAVADSFTVSDRVTAVVDGLNSLRPSANDYDADGDVISITAKTNPAHGVVTIVGGNVIEYQPTVSYTGADTFTYTISDGRGGSSTATVTLTLANSAPVAAPDRVSVERGGVVTFDPRLNDRDPNGDAVTVTSPSAPSKGSAVLNPDQSITYSNSSGSGADSLTYLLTDARGASTTGFVTVSISPNTPPKARSDTLAASGVAVSMDPRANDTDIDGDPLTVISVTQPTHGAAVVSAGGTTVTYTPTSGYFGDDRFTYAVADDEGAQATATVAVNALNVEYLVVAGGGGGGINWPGGGGGGGGGGLLRGETQMTSGALRTVTVGAGGAGGYPATGPDTVGVSGGNSSFGSLSAIGGGGGRGYGAAKTGGSGGGSSAAGTPGQGYPGGPAATAAQGGGGGAAGPGGAAYYTEIYEEQDLGGAGPGGPGVDSDITGSVVNYAAGGGSGGHANEEMYIAPGLAGGSSATNGVYGYTAATAPAGRGGGGGGSGSNGLTGGVGGAGGSGVVIVRYSGAPKAAGGTITQLGSYTIHTFTAGGTFTVTQTNTRPVANNDSVSTPGWRISFDPRVNDTDPQGDPLRVSSVGAASHGATSVDPGGLAITYRPAAGYVGTDAFSYVVTDDSGGTATATVSVTVTAVSTGRQFSISPAVNGKTVWDLDADGPLKLSSAGTWTATPQQSFQAVVKAWGAAGGSSYGPGGAGGYASGTVAFESGVSYRLDVGSGGGGRLQNVAGTPGGATTSDWGGSGGGFSAIRKTSGLTGVLVAGAGGGAGWSGIEPHFGRGGAGGGAAAQSGAGSSGGAGGTQTTGAAPYQGGSSGGRGGAGGGGFFGGDGGAGGVNANGGGGGSGYLHPTEVASGTLIAGVGALPGNSADPDRGNAGDPFPDNSGSNGPGRPGRLVFP